MKIDRKILQGIRKEASELAEVTPRNSWHYAYRALAKACDHLDAIMARSSAGAAHHTFEGGVGELVSSGTDHAQGGCPTRSGEEAAS